MKKIVPVFLIAICAATSLHSQDLPKEWTKDFVITLDYSGNMIGGFTKVRFTYDSCIYNASPSHSEKPQKKVYLLKAADRAEILRKLRELKADKIKSESSINTVNDGWAQSMCLGSHCVDGGTNVEMDEQNKNRFLDAYRYLEEFAMNKGKKIRQS